MAELQSRELKPQPWHRVGPDAKTSGQLRNTAAWPAPPQDLEPLPENKALDFDVGEYERFREEEDRHTLASDPPDFETDVPAEEALREVEAEEAELEEAIRVLLKRHGAAAVRRRTAAMIAHEEGVRQPTALPGEHKQPLPSSALSTHLTPAAEVSAEPAVSPTPDISTPAAPPPPTLSPVPPAAPRKPRLPSA
eukprot:Hpha_TRINITY_DN15617_c0_g5::TRINITY_DN15617_c0_g5_i1::g.101613::m.101613